MDFDYKKILRSYIGKNMDTLESALGDNAYSVGGMQITSGIIYIKYSCSEITTVDLFPKLTEFNNYIINFFEANENAVIQELSYGSVLIQFDDSPKKGGLMDVVNRYYELLNGFRPKISMSVHYGISMLCNWGGIDRISLQLIGKSTEFAKAIALAGFQKDYKISISENAVSKFSFRIEHNNKFTVGIVGEPPITVYFV